MPHSSELTIAQKAALKVYFARSYAISSAHNRRNLEFPWYAAWCHTLTHLVEEFADLIVCPQYTIYFTREPPACEEPEEDDVLCEQDFPDLNTIVSTTNLSNNEDELADDLDFPDTSFSTIGTQPDKSAETLITDFAIIHVSPIRVKAHHGRYGGWRILEVSVPLLVENKRYTERTLTGNERVADIMPLIGTARDDVEMQAAYTFQKHPHMKSLVGIAACGPWWACATLTPELVQRSLEFLPQKRQKSRWGRLVKLNTPSSDRCLEELQASLQEMSQNNFI